MSRKCIASMLAMVVLETAIANGQLLYDVRFDSPGDVIGSPIAMGSSSASPSATVSDGWGTAIVRGSVGGLSDQPAALVASGFSRYGIPARSGIHLKVGEMPSPVPFPAYRVTFDAWLGDMAPASTFWLVFDTLSVGVEFAGSGEILSNPLQIAGTYSPAQVLHVDMTTCVADRSSCLLVNGEPITADFRLNTADVYPFLLNVSIGLSSSLPGDGETVGIDNIQVYGIPEPATLMLLAFGGFALRGRRPKRL